MTKPRLYLDVDGVINAFGTGPSVWPTEEGGTTNGYYIVWSPEMIAELDALDVELVWTTTWRDKAPTHIAPLVGYKAGLTGRVIVEPVVLGDWSWWKLRAVKADQAANPGPFIWIDDDHAWDGTVPFETVQPNLVIKPNVDEGITPEHIASIKAFLAALPTE